MSSTPGSAAATIDLLQRWSPLAPSQARLRDEYLAFIADLQGAAVGREDSPEHLTGSCFVLTPDLSQVLLCFHVKGRFWVQLGGHVEPGDRSIAAAAYREAHEESGIADLRPFGPLPVDLHRHPLASSFGSCRVHWDVGFVAFAPVGAVPVVSAESEAVAWFRVDQLPPEVPEDFPGRLRTVLDELAHQRCAAR